MKLIIAEKPSVAFAIAKALNIKGSKDGYIENTDYVISWCVGHLVALAEPSAYDEKYLKWNYADLPIIPQDFQYKIYGGKQKQFNVVKALMNRKDITEVINACDAGREGELIFRLVYAQANCRKPIKRLWISSMEESAIREGFASLKDGAEYDNLYHSALCRLWADWLVGINATRLFSLLYRKTLNIGRVQTPTLALLADRHNKISFFQKEKYFTATLDIDGVKAETERIDNEDTAKEVITACEHSQAVCVSVKKEQKTEKPPKLFDLTSLQRAANRLYGYTAKQTADLSQSLYEKKLITYPRTDSRYLTEEMAETVISVIRLGVRIPSFDKAVPGLYDVLGEYESLDELNYLASRIEQLDKSEWETFNAAVEMGEYTDSVKDLINLTENLDCYNFYSDIHSDSDLGYYWIEESGAYDTKAMGRLSSYIDYEAFGRDIRLEECGDFTDNGYIVNNYGNFIERYNGDREEIPDEYRVFVSEDEPTLETITEDEKQAFVDGIELSLDYQLTEGITQSDMDLYNAIIQERVEREKPSIKEQLQRTKNEQDKQP